MKGHVRLFSILLSLVLLLGAVGCTPTPSDPTVEPNTPDQDEQPSPETPPQEIDINSLPDGPQDKIAPDADVYATSAETLTSYTGEEIDVKQKDLTYGGAQYVTKLFTRVWAAVRAQMNTFIICSRSRRTAAPSKR